MAPDTLAAQDAFFLRFQDANTHMHIASLLTFDGGPAPLEQVRHTVGSRLHLVPRFRQRLVEVPFRQGQPVWVDDATFDLRRHVRGLSLPRLDPADIRWLCGQLLSEPLDPNVPLWEMWLLNGPDRFAILTKVHHAMWDGVTGAGIHMAFLDTGQERTVVEPEPWTPDPAPSQTRLLAGAVAERAREPLRLASALGRAVGAPGRVAGTSLALVGGAAALAKARFAPHVGTMLDSRIGPARRLDVARGSLDAVKAIRRAFGGTVNDVVLTAVAGALGGWLGRLGERVDEVRAMVPVSVREPGDHAGNRLALMIVPLPVGELHPIGRLQRVRLATAAAKSSGQSMVVDTLTRLSSLVPPALTARLAGMGRSQRLFDLLVTNVPGPPMPLYAEGHRVVDMFPVAPLAANTSLNVAALSHAGRLGFGVLSDPDVARDAHLVAQGIERALRELEAAAQPLPAVVREPALSR